MQFDYLTVCLSTATIGLLSSVQGQLSVASAEAEEQAKEVDYSNIWTPKKFHDVEYWFLKTGKLHFMFVFCYFRSFFSPFLPPPLKVSPLSDMGWHFGPILMMNII
jgi:hypothetical protein